MGYDFITIDALTGKHAEDYYISYNWSAFSQYFGVRDHVHRRNTNDIKNRCYTGLGMMIADGYIMGTPREDIDQNRYWGSWNGVTDNEKAGVFMWHIVKLIEYCTRNPDVFMFADIQDDEDNGTVWVMNQNTKTSLDDIRIIRANTIANNDK